jgi:integrase
VWYVYAWRGGPCIHKSPVKPTITLDILDKQRSARMERGAPGELTVDSMIDAYRASPEFDKLAASTQRDYRLWLNRISERFGKAPMGVFGDPRVRGDIIAWRDTWASQPRTADKASVMMATLLGYAVERGVLPMNYGAKIKQLHKSDRSDLIWEERHWTTIEDLPAHIMDAIKLASLTGLRLGDLVRLEWANVGEAAIVVTTRKRKGRAVIPIFPELRAWLDARDRKHPTVLVNSRGGAWTESGLETVWQRRKPAGFDRRLHDLRGTFVTFLAIKGLTDQEIARIIGWTAQRVAEIRARYVDEARVVISLMERLSA